MALQQINYAELKAAMRSKGYDVSEGDIWRPSDAKLFRDFHYLEGVDETKAHYGQAYTSLLPETFPGVGVVAESAPQELVENEQAAEDNEPDEEPAEEPVEQEPVVQPEVPAEDTAGGDSVTTTTTTTTTETTGGTQNTETVQNTETPQPDADQE